MAIQQTAHTTTSLLMNLNVLKTNESVKIKHHGTPHQALGQNYGVA